MSHKWTQQEKKFILDNSATMSDEEIAKALSQMSRFQISINAVRKQRQRLGVKKLNGRGKIGLRLPKSGI